MTIRMRSAAALLFAAASLSACVREAHIATPGELAQQSDRLELRGMGGGTRGDFRLAGATGHFTRSAERLGLFDPLLVDNRGGGSFIVSGGEIDGELYGRCRFTRREVNVGPITATPDRLLYLCEFGRDGRRLDAELVLEETRDSKGALFSKAERKGELNFEGQRIAIRSIHRDQGGGLASATPLGYLFEAEGRGVGAIDLNGANKTFYAPRNPETRQAVIAAGLALSIFWDPADVDPGV